VGTTGELRNRQDAIRLLDTVCEFLMQSEPSNPAPLLIRRAQRLIGSDFLDIMRDMAPDGLGQIEVIAGLKGATPSPTGGGRFISPDLALHAFVKENPR
jgi:type VI secretion system protein ImpA